MERFLQGFYNSAIDMDKNNLIQTENQYARIKQIPQMICNPISTAKPHVCLLKQESVGGFQLITWALNDAQGSSQTKLKEMWMIC